MSSNSQKGNVYLKQFAAGEKFMVSSHKTMRALLLTRYGSVDKLDLADIPLPEPGENQLLVKVKATAVNDWDWCVLQGSPFYMRLIAGLFKPKIKIMGVDLAGEIVALGKNITNFKVGDKVYGDLSNSGFGAFAEYVCVPPESVALIPEGMSFIEAAAIPHAALLALQGLRDIGKIQPGQRVLINGAGGGVGTLGVQIAKFLGASHVTGVDSTSKEHVMQAAGFDQVLDYQMEDFTQSSEKYDIILDTKNTRSPFRYVDVLKPNGKYICVGGNITRILQTLLFSKFIKLLYKKQVSVLALIPNKGLDDINHLFKSYDLKTFIDGPYPFSRIKVAIEHYGKSHHCGKVIIYFDD